MRLKIVILFLFAVFFSKEGNGQFATSNVVLDGDTSETWYVTDVRWCFGWDNDSFYVYKDNSIGTDPVLIYFDINPIFPVNGGNKSNGLLVGTTHFGIQPNLPFRADARIYWSDTACKVKIVDTSGAGSWVSSGSIVRNKFFNIGGAIKRELAIPWTQLGASGIPSIFNFCGYTLNPSSAGCGGLNAFYDITPFYSNVQGCGVTTPNIEYYWHIPNSGASNPFTFRSYTYLGASQNLGNFNIYNFTHNNPTKTITKTGKWKVNGTLAVAYGKIDFSSNTDSLIVIDSLVVLGSGELDLNSSTSNIWVRKNLRNKSKLKLSTNSTSKLVIGGNFQNWGTFRGNKTKIVMKTTAGLSAPTITGISFRDSAAINKLEIDNSGTSVTINVTDSLCVKDSLILSAGKLVTSSSSAIRLRNNAKTDSLNYTSTAFVDGPMLWETFGTAERIFPIGDNGQFGRIGIKPTQNDTQSPQKRIYQAEYYKAGFTNTTSLVNYTTHPLNRVSTVEYWNLEEMRGATGVNKEVKVKLFWSNYSGVSSTAANRTDLRVCYWNGSAWGRVTDNSAIRDAGVSNGNVMGDSATNSLLYFTLGSYISNNLLPVTLTKFYALKNNAGIDIHWQTASEINCDYYEVWKSDDNQHYELIGTTKGQGNSYQLSNYKLRDVYPNQKTNYYKLIQADFNGKTETFGPVILDNSERNSISVNPNPASTFIEISNPDNIQFSGFEIYDNMGKMLKKVMDAAVSIPIDDLNEGLYFIKALSGTRDVFSTRFIILK